MKETVLNMVGNQAILHVHDHICTSARELMHSEMFSSMLHRYMVNLQERKSTKLSIFDTPSEGVIGEDKILDLLRILSNSKIERVSTMLPWAEHFLDPERRLLLQEYVEGFYDYWRAFDRYMILHSEEGPSSYDHRPYRSFASTLENLDNIVRALFRDIREHVCGLRPRVYRQVAAGCDAGFIAVPQPSAIPEPYRALLEKVPFVRQIMITPPMTTDPTMNTRTGRFEAVDSNPFEKIEPLGDDFICFPILVGPLKMFVYVQELFIGLGCALANLFEIADDHEVTEGPDAIYVFGAPTSALAHFGDLPTIFHEDNENKIMTAAVPAEDRFGYFGYLKKMILTLHNVIMMRRGLMPFHGAMVRIQLKTGNAANILILGDTAAGKSESLEALRTMSGEELEEMRIIADDMGSLAISEEGRVLGYGTEIGAFVRLDDLQQGYAFEQLDRAIFMSPHKVNARVVLPVTKMNDVLRGFPVDYLLYANNYETVDEEHPVVEPFESVESALDTFRAGAAMSKGTTTSSGLQHSYFANIFGPPQYRDLHEPLAKATFEAAFNSDTFVGTMRTRLAIPGFSSKGPEATAKALLKMIREE